MPDEMQKPMIAAVIAAKDALLAKGYIYDRGWSFTLYPLELGGGVKADFSKCMTPKWKRAIRYWTREKYAPKRA